MNGVCLSALKLDSRFAEAKDVAYAQRHTEPN